MTGVDARGTRHRRCDDRAKLRIVSLVPSLTELRCDLGLAYSVVGRTAQCVHPADDVDRIATVGRIGAIHVEQVRRLAPTHLVIDADESDAAAVAAIESFVPHVIVVAPRVPRDNLALYRLFGDVFNGEREADRLAARFEASWSALRQARSIGTRPPQRVLFVTSKDPWTVAPRDGYAAAMLALIDWEQVDGATRPDRLLLASSARGFTGTDVVVLRNRAPHVQLVDDTLLSWSGSRAIKGLDYLMRLAADESD